MSTAAEQRLRPLFLDVSGLDLERLATFGTGLAEWQAGVMWWIGDVARYAEARFPETWHQVFPETVSPGMIARAAAVAKAYPREEDRNPLASWTIHMRNANQPDRIERVQKHVDAGRTTDEANAADKQEQSTRWLLAIDVHYFVHRTWFSGGGVETAVGVSSWVQRTVDRLKVKGLTDVACCFDSRGNFRRELTEDTTARRRMERAIDRWRTADAAERLRRERLQADDDASRRRGEAA